MINDYSKKDNNGLNTNADRKQDEDDKDIAGSSRTKEDRRTGR